ncbi:MAG: DUF6519 domain-containing protein [Planctomycetota bacterium]
MAGDITRKRFKPTNNYAAVLEQQGRVRLDADHNEAVDIVDRRTRTGAFDTLTTSFDATKDGKCVVPRTTEDAFLLVPTGTGALSIGRGRAYVDGIQIENHGTGTPSWDRFLEEERAPDPTPLEAQPYPHDEIDLKVANAAGRRDLFYVDVFRRELEPAIWGELLDDALGGVDTTTRAQTVWQVRAILGVGEDVDCDTPLDLARSGGRLTTSTLAPTPSEDPCIVTGAGGYRGIENRLYRVEVHEDGALGAATFKWCKNNASIVTRVTGITDGTDEIVVESLGRDQELSFSAGYWIELNDVHRDLAGKSGHMFRVKEVREADNVLVVDPIIPTGVFDAADADRRTFVRRWDQRQGDTTGGLETVDAGPIAIGTDGVQLAFSTDGVGEFKRGDAWVFHARTASGSIEELDKAPPRERHHHYAALGFVTWGPDAASSQVEDCRQLWPRDLRTGAGCCTVVVHPGESIQDAIDSLPAEGGCVCLKSGTHKIGEAILITRSDVSLHGESPGTIVQRDDASEALFVTSVAGLLVERVRIEGIRFQAVDEGAVMVGIFRALDVAIVDCGFEVPPGDEQVFGILARECANLQVGGNRLSNLMFGVMVQSCGGEIAVEGNQIVAPPSAERDTAAGGILILQSAPKFPVDVNTLADLRISIVDNHVTRYSLGVYVGANEPSFAPEIQDAAAIRIETNHIAREGQAIFSDLTLADGFAYGISLHASIGSVRDNVVAPSAAGEHAGIQLYGSRLQAVDNHVAGPEDLDVRPAIGIAVGTMTIDADDPPEDMVVSGNFVADHGDGIRVEFGRRVRLLDNTLLAGTNTADAGIALVSTVGTEARDNRIEGFARGVWDQQSRGTLIAGSNIRTAKDAGLRLEPRGPVVLDGNRLEQVGVGILVRSAQFAELKGNAVRVSSSYSAIVVAADNRAVIHGDRYEYAFSGQPTAGTKVVAAVQISADTVEVRDCEIRDPGFAASGQATIDLAVVGLEITADRVDVQHNAITFSDSSAVRDRTKEHRSLIMFGPDDLRQELRLGSALVHGNRFEGPGASYLVQIGEPDPADKRGYAQLSFHDNVALHDNLEGVRSAVLLEGAECTVVGNALRGRSGAAIFDFDSNRGLYMGNLAQAEPINYPVPKPAPLADFNHIP